MVDPLQRKPHGGPAPESPGTAETRAGGQFARGAGLVLLAVLVFYLPALRAGYIWDDSDYAGHWVLRHPAGLRLIWFEPQVLPQYYPLVYTSYWIENRAWGLRPFGYHLVNVLLHWVCAVGLWAVLRRLAAPGAFLAAAVFALHPVCVESVAWITQRKNVLSGAFYFLSILSYLRFCGIGAAAPPRSRRRFYLLSLGLFGAALLSKTATVPLPAVLLVLLWWKRPRLGRRDVLPLVPFFGLAVAMGLLTAYLESEHVGAGGAEWAFSIVERFLIAGRALWFYASKLVWPHKLTFVYPRWGVDAGAWRQYLFPAGAVAALAALWLLRRRIGRGPLAAALIFAGTLLPVLGFLRIYFTRYSFVADHWQYLACGSLIALLTGAATKAVASLGAAARRVGVGAAVVLVLLFGAMTWRQAAIYRDVRTLWEDTLRKDPGSPIAHNNLGTHLFGDGKLDEAKWHYEQALASWAEYAEAHNNLALVLDRNGDRRGALGHFREAIGIKPNYANAHANLAALLDRQGKPDEAIEHYRKAVEINPALTWANCHLGLALAKRGDDAAAESCFREVLRLRPRDTEALSALGALLTRTARAAEAIPYLRRAVGLRNEDPELHYRLAAALAATGRFREAIEQYEKAIGLRGGHLEAKRDLAWLLATCPDEELRDGAKAAWHAKVLCEASGYRNHAYLDTLAAAYAAMGKHDQAAETAQKALELARAEGADEAAREYRKRLELYRAGRPYVAPSPPPGGKGHRRTGQ
jgi:tetratricopeptide (TPR) repeat protein